MILSPRCKLSLFDTETWDTEDMQRYNKACRERFTTEYEGKDTATENTDIQSNKRSAPSDDPEFQQVLAQRSVKRHHSDYDRYIELPNDTSISSSLDWWRTHRSMYPDLAKMARDILVVPASGCTVERVFSVSGRIATWQRNRLSADSITNIMMFKSGMKNMRWKVPDTMSDESEDFEVPEQLGCIPPEWYDQWWKEKLKYSVRVEVMAMFPSLG